MTAALAVVLVLGFLIGWVARMVWVEYQTKATVRKIVQAVEDEHI